MASSFLGALITHKRKPDSASLQGSTPGTLSHAVDVDEREMAPGSEGTRSHRHGAASASTGGGETSQACGHEHHHVLEREVVPCCSHSSGAPPTARPGPVITEGSYELQQSQHQHQHRREHGHHHEHHHEHEHGHEHQQHLLVLEGNRFTCVRVPPTLSSSLCFSDHGAGTDNGSNSARHAEQGRGRGTPSSASLVGAEAQAAGGAGRAGSASACSTACAAGGTAAAPSSLLGCPHSHSSEPAGGEKGGGAAEEVQRGEGGGEGSCTTHYSSAGCGTGACGRMHGGPSAHTADPVISSPGAAGGADAGAGASAGADGDGGAVACCSTEGLHVHAHVHTGDRTEDIILEPVSGDSTGEGVRE